MPCIIKINKILPCVGKYQGIAVLPGQTDSYARQSAEQASYCLRWHMRPSRTQFPIPVANFQNINTEGVRQGVGFVAPKNANVRSEPTVRTVRTVRNTRNKAFVMLGSGVRSVCGVWCVLR